jgi:hypothetical protein
MGTLESQLVLTGSLFLLTLGSGFWLSNSGKPYNSAIFTIHKLIALGAIIVTAITIYHLQKTAELKMVVEIYAIVITGLLFLSLLVSGGLLSIGKPAFGFIRRIHHVAPYLAVISTVGLIYLLAR